YYPETWSNWVLAFCAVWAGCMALRTLRAIEGQSNIMVSKERARLKIEILDLHLVQSNQRPCITEVNFRVVYYGTTEAFKVTSQVWVEIRDNAEPAPSEGTGTTIRMPRVVSKDTALEDQRFLINPPLLVTSLTLYRTGRSLFTSLGE
ncbi:MAG TPA: hypothetical protein VIJ38_15550, partial [Acidobacteriaceae bacterium]